MQSVHDLESGESAMRRTDRGVTITELLTVVSLLTILTSIVSPVLLTVKHAALARACSNNCRQVYVALQLIANGNYGKYPPCVVLDTTANPLQLIDYGLKEDQWWYRKVSKTLYPTKDPLAGNWLPPEHNALRCPASADPYDQARVKGNYTQVVSVGSTGDKDRVFDDNFGFNNFGFKYAGPVGTSRETVPAIPNTDVPTWKWGAIGNSFYYRASAPSGGWGAGIVMAGRPKHMYDSSKDSGGVKYCNCDTGTAPRKTWPCAYAYLGEFSTVPDAARTMMMMDYIKADVAPNLVNDGLRGFRFRHGGRANVLFVDGHVNLMHRQEYQKDWAEPDHTAFARDTITARPRIHWFVLRP